MLGEAFVQEGKVGVDHIPRRQVFLQQLGEEQPRLGERGLDQRFVEIVIGIECIGRRGGVVFPQLEPVIEKCVDETAGLRVVQQALGLGAKHLGPPQFAAGGAGAQRLIGRRVRQEKREPRRQREVVEPAGFFLEKKKSGRAQDPREGCDHRIREIVSILDLAVEDREVALHLGLLHGPAIRPRYKAAQQPFGVGSRRRRHDLHRHLGRAHHAAVSAGALHAAIRWIRERGHRHLGLTRRTLLERQVAEELPVSGGRRLVPQWPLDLHPTECHRRGAVALGEWTRDRAGAVAEKPRGVGDERLVGGDPNGTEVEDLRLRRQVKFAEAADLGRALGVDGDRLIAPARGDVVSIRLIPVGLAVDQDPLPVRAPPGPGGETVRTHPDRVAAPAHSIAARDGSTEIVPDGVKRMIVAAHPPHGLEFARRRIAVADGQRCRPRPHVRRRSRAQNRKRHALGPRVVIEPAEKRPGPPALIPGIVFPRGRGRQLEPREFNAQNLADRVLREPEVTRHLHMRDIEHVPDFVEKFGLAVLGQVGFHLQPRYVEEIAQGVLEFVAVESPLGGSTLLLGDDALMFGQGSRHALDKPRRVAAVRTLLVLGRHFARLHPVVHQHPALRRGGIVGGKREVRDVEATLLVDVVVAARTVLFRERHGARNGRSRSGRRRAEQPAGHRESADRLRHRASDRRSGARKQLGCVEEGRVSA